MRQIKDSQQNSVCLLAVYWAFYTVKFEKSPVYTDDQVLAKTGSTADGQLCRVAGGEPNTASWGTQCSAMCTRHWTHSAQCTCAHCTPRTVHTMGCTEHTLHTCAAESAVQTVGSAVWVSQLQSRGSTKLVTVVGQSLEAFLWGLWLCLKQSPPSDMASAVYSWRARPIGSSWCWDSSN